jgi:prepilin-type N-terminal cleavage/methylation domain-containing protein
VRAGFTLVEVMVAVAVASLLIVGVTASTQATIRTAERQKSDAQAAEQRSRAVELLRQDWRGRVRLVTPALPPPVGVRMLVMTTTSDPVSATNGRGSRLVTYTASEKGLFRKEGDAELSLLNGPVQLDFWDGAAWRETPAGRRPALRLRLQNPEESVVLR